MIYILDSSFFIETSRLHLPLDKQPIFWNWLVKLAKAKVISIPSMVYEELIASEKPGKQTAPRNKKIPSVCKVLHVPCCTITSFLWQMRVFMPK